MTNNTPPAAPRRPEIAKEMLRIAKEKLESADLALSYFISTAREHDLPWADIAHEVGLSEVTCRKRASDYNGGKA